MKKGNYGALGGKDFHHQGNKLWYVGFLSVKPWDDTCLMDKNGEQKEYDSNSPIKCHQGSLEVVYVFKI